MSGERFEDYCQVHIFGPLGMAHTTFMLPKVDADRLLQAHVLDGSGNPVVSDIYPYALQRAPSCTLHSNVADMSRWLVAHLNHGKLGQARILKTASHKQLWQPMDVLDPSAGFDYCWGCFTAEMWDTLAVGYFGGILTQTAIFMAPKYDMAAIAFSNLDAPWVVGDIPFMALTWMIEGKCCRPATPVGHLRLNAWKNGLVH